MATMPHCDSAVLHAPGECEYCDAYPEFQKARKMWGIAFTGQPPTDEQPLLCPSEVRRDLDTINRWPGNRPASSPDTHTTSTASTFFIDTAISADRLKNLVRETVEDILREER